MWFDFCHRGHREHRGFYWFFVGAALAANNPSDRDGFAAEAAPTKLKTSVFSVTSVAN